MNPFTRPRSTLALVDANPTEVAAAAHARRMLTTLGIPCNDESTRDTPERMVRALNELIAGTRVNPDRHLTKTFPPTDEPGMIVVPGIEIASVCQHHLLPFSGTCAVAYLPAPGARVVGLSKLARVAQEYAARPQMQERLGEEIVQAISRNLDVQGAACVIRCAHACMATRGVKAAHGSMVTTHMAGRFKDDAALRTEFLLLAGGAG
jgi:GTP cyclohydrolase I